MRGEGPGGGGVAAGTADGERGAVRAAIEENGVVDAAFDGAVVPEDGVGDGAEALGGIGIVDDEGFVGEIAGGHYERRKKGLRTED